MNNDRSTRSRLASATSATRIVPALAIALTAMMSALAQDASETVTEEIVVIGIRGSLDRALGVKRNANGFADAVSAEDVGKLPDHNIAEALQRVPGVAISRNRGEGDFISIRGLGPNFVRGTINGQTLVSATETRHATRSGAVESSTGRETNFDVLPTEVINRLEVFKTPSAEHVEGGIGGVVNVQTHQPLGLGNRMAGSVQATYRGFNGETDPSASGIASWVDDDGTFGLLGAIAYSRRSIREDENDSYGYADFDLPIDTMADGTADLTGAFHPFANNPAIYHEDRERTTLQGAAQWQLGGTSALTLNAMYSNRDIGNLGTLLEIGVCCDFNKAVLGNGIKNADKSQQIPGIDVVDNTAVGYPFSSVVAVITDEQVVDDDLYNVSLTYEADFSDDWNVSADLAYAAAEGYLSFQRVSMATYDNVPFDLSVANRQINLAQRPGGPDLSDLSSYFTRNADAIERFNKDDEFALAFDAARSMQDQGWLSAVKFGARYRSRNKDKNDHTNQNANNDEFDASGIGTDNTFSAGSLLGGDTPIPFADIPFPDVSAQRAYVMGQNPAASFDSPFSALLSYATEEDTLAAYVQLDIDGNWGEIPVTGNVGIRYVQTQQDIGAYSQPFRINNDETSSNNLGTVEILDPTVETDVFSSDYTNVLPSLNLRFELNNDVVVRVAASQSVSRPTFSQLAPGLTSINPTQRQANSGNPDLVAYESTNFDLGIEWYFADTSIVYVSAFAKRMDNFIGTVTALAPRGAGHDGDGDGIEDGLGSEIVRFGVGFASLSQPQNQGEAGIDGIEIGYQHVYENGFGYLVNATAIDSSAEFVSGSKAGEILPFEGVSDSSYNVTVFYENERFQARLAYSYRDKFVFPTLSSDVFTNTVYFDDYAQLDGSFSYIVSDTYTVFFNAINITGEDRSLFSDIETRPISLARVGSRYELGFRGSF